MHQSCEWSRPQPGLSQNLVWWPPTALIHVPVNCPAPPPPGPACSPGGAALRTQQTPALCSELAACRYLAHRHPLPQKPTRQTTSSQPEPGSLPITEASLHTGTGEGPTGKESTSREADRQTDRQTSATTSQSQFTNLSKRLEGRFLNFTLRQGV